MKKMNVLIGLLTLAVTSNAFAIKSMNLPIDLGKPRQYATYKSNPVELSDMRSHLNDTWQIHNQKGMCNDSDVEAALYKNVGDGSIIRSRLLSALKKTTKVKLLGDLPPMSVYNINNKGKVVHLGFNQMEIQGSQSLLVLICRMK